MPRERKTIDTWEIHVNYGDGYEHECTEFTKEELAEQKRCYAENCGYPFKVVSKRVPKSEFSAEELADIERRKVEYRRKRVAKARHKRHVALQAPFSLN